MPALKGLNPNLAAFLDMIAESELTGMLALPGSDNGYNLLVGSTPKKLLTFNSYAQHPNVLNRALNSTAAGRYQQLHRNWLAYGRLLSLKDFGPENQDRIAVRQIGEAGGIALIKDGRIREAIRKCSHLWASLPGNNYGQHVHPVEWLLQQYTKAGGMLEE